MNEKLQILNKYLNNKVQANVDLAEYSWLKVGGSAQYFLLAENEDEIIQAIKTAQEIEIPYYLLGGASNVIINTFGVDGLVIKINNQKLEFIENIVQVGAGVELQTLVTESINKGLAGLAKLTHIPGSVGGALYGNAGAYGDYIGELVKEVIVFNGIDIVKYSQADCGFKYRDSIFKNKKKGEVILSCVLELKSGNSEELKEIATNIVNEKNAKHPREFPTLGCTFKNVELKEGVLELKYPQQGNILPRLQQEIDVDKFIKLGYLPAGVLIASLDLKGHSVGGIKVSEKHANFLINTGKATSDNFAIMVSYLKTQVRDKFGIQLEEEIQYLGFD